MHKIRADLRILRVTAVDVASGGFELGAKIFLTRPTIFAMTSGGRDPRHADTLTDLYYGVQHLQRLDSVYNSNNLMSKNHW